MGRGLRTSSLRAGHPDFLDLPWDYPLTEWEGRTDRLEKMPAGDSRHPVVFVNYNGAVYAVKSLTRVLASKEYAALRAMESKRLPVVTPVGLVQTETEEGEAGVLITRYLDHSLPYHQLFLQSMLSRYRASLLDALAGLLVELHLAGVYWGDCSLFNALFLRDAGRLRAYLVDAETSEVHDRISDTMRDYELQVMFENVTGGMSDLVALGALPKDEPVEQTAQAIEQRYR
ncbi:MAG: lipopolysaccharide kinase InaA family protein, partial [Myxococcota bacterium]